jgi:N-acetylglucosamine kinase-like BadF-type ATPase
MSRYVLGLDGGGTKTVAVLAEDTGKLLARAQGDSSNYQVIGGEKLGQVIRELCKEILLQANLQGLTLDHLYAGLAGAGRPADREAIHSVITQQNVAATVTVDTDASAALAGAFAGGPGIIVISGTGAICFGKSKANVVHRCGGWGYLLGDEGSGYYIGQQAIMAALKDLDGRGIATSLRAMIEQKYNLASIDLIISQIYSGKIDRTEIASLTPAVFAEYEKGDEASKIIIETAGREIGKIVAAVSHKMGLEKQQVEVALIGSVFKQRHILVPFMETEALRVVQKVDFIDPRFEPAIGSAVLALQKENIAVTESVLANLIKTA